MANWMTDDERAFIRLLKATYPWMTHIGRNGYGVLAIYEGIPEYTRVGGLAPRGEHHAYIPDELLPGIGDAMLLRLEDMSLWKCRYQAVWERVDND